MVLIGYPLGDVGVHGDSEIFGAWDSCMMVFELGQTACTGQIIRRIFDQCTPLCNYNALAMVESLGPVLVISLPVCVIVVDAQYEPNIYTYRVPCKRGTFLLLPFLANAIATNVNIVIGGCVLNAVIYSCVCINHKY